MDGVMQMLTKTQKIEVVEKMKQELKHYPIIAVADLTGLPARHYTFIKKKIPAKIVFARKTLMEKALVEARPEAKELIILMKGVPALVLSSADAFKLFKEVKKNKSKTFAKAGAIAPQDIVVPAGETPFGWWLVLLVVGGQISLWFLCQTECREVLRSKKTEFIF